MEEGTYFKRDEAEISCSTKRRLSGNVLCLDFSNQSLKEFPLTEAAVSTNLQVMEFKF